MDQNRTSSSNTTQHEKNGNTIAFEDQTMDTTNTPVTQFVHPPMIPQLNPLYYWPYLPANPFAPFAFGPQLQVPYFLYPTPAAAWYYFQQCMMSSPAYVQPVPFGVPLSVTSQIPVTQSTNSGPATLITNNIVTFNEIGNDNSTNLKIKKNGHRNTG